ncbi:MAG: LdpA C-terminal domain-containing domain [Synechococcaceae cyanobacterium ELA445]
MPPERALAEGRWVKLICGASNQDLPAIEDLCGIYSLVGVDCIDVAADPAVVSAARRGMDWAIQRGAAPPWLMVSLSDGADPHFRKATFDPALCPAECPRPCQRVCPALAIGPSGGVAEDRCYGCGRCLPLCPHGLIAERDHLLAAEAVAPLLARLRPDAVEIHTRMGREHAFAERLDQVSAAVVPLQRLAVSCGPDDCGLEGEGSEAAAARLAEQLWQRFTALRARGFRPLWQLDGRPMSGDLGAGTAHAAVRLLRELRELAPPGPLQLAGGTNESTLPRLRRLGVRRAAAGVAFGGIARRLLQPLLARAAERGTGLLADEALVAEAVALAGSLVGPWRAQDGSEP